MFGARGALEEERCLHEDEEPGIRGGEVHEEQRLVPPSTLSFSAAVMLGLGGDVAEMRVLGILKGPR